MFNMVRKKLRYWQVSTFLCFDLTEREERKARKKLEAEKRKKKSRLAKLEKQAEKQRQRKREAEEKKAKRRQELENTRYRLKSTNCFFKEFAYNCE